MLLSGGSGVGDLPPPEHTASQATDASSPRMGEVSGLFVWLVADGRCWFVLREKYCWLVADGWLF
jgi:hypothetical protein